MSRADYFKNLSRILPHNQEKSMNRNSKRIFNQKNEDTENNLDDTSRMRDKPQY